MVLFDTAHEREFTADGSPLFHKLCTSFLDVLKDLLAFFGGGAR